MSSPNPVLPTTLGNTSTHRGTSGNTSQPQPTFNATGRDTSIASRNMMKLTDIQQHETFYCAVQAAAYVACFHGVYLLHEHMSNETIRRQWEYILTSSLNPLKYCLHSVKSEFLRVVKAMEFLRPECVNLLSTTKGEGQGSEGVSSHAVANPNSNNLSANPNPLDSFFPFDPCLLASLNTQFIDASYRSWVGIPGLDYDDDDSRLQQSQLLDSYDDHHMRRAGSSSSASSDGFSDCDTSHYSARSDDYYAIHADGPKFNALNDRVSNLATSLTRYGTDARAYSGLSGLSEDGEDGKGGPIRSMSVSWTANNMPQQFEHEANDSTLGDSDEDEFESDGVVDGHEGFDGRENLSSRYNNAYGRIGSSLRPIKRRRQPSIGSNVSSGSW